MKKILFISIIVTTLVLIIIAGCKDSAKTTEDNEQQEPTDWSKVSWEWASPYEEPKGDKIVFLSDRDGNYEIYMVNIDGSELKRITDSEGDEYYPDLSPDGTKVTFSYPHSIKNEEDEEIYIMNTDGAGRKKLTDNEAYDWDPCFSPDGSKIAFSSTRDGNSEIYTMNTDGSNQTRLTDSPRGDFDPCFSPDGSKIAFVSERDGIVHIKKIDNKDIERIYNTEIYIMNIDGSSQTRLTYNDENKCQLGAPIDENPFFSPDGEKIALTSHCEGGGIYIMDIDGSGQEEFIRITSNDASYCLSPDLSKFAVTVYPELGEGEGGEIFLYNVDDWFRKYGVNLSNNPVSDEYMPSF